jgi:hypothetical protein
MVMNLILIVVDQVYSHLYVHDANMVNYVMRTPIVRQLQGIHVYQVDAFIIVRMEFGIMMNRVLTVGKISLIVVLVIMSLVI